MSTAIESIPLRTLTGEATTLSAWSGKVLLIVNTASECGFTPQYAGLEALFADLGPKGLVVLGFPCNQFGAQEPGGAEQIGAFCQRNYGVSFPMMEKVDVNGPDAHPLWVRLREEAPGLLGTTAIKWNFTKFLVDRQGRVRSRHAPNESPESLRPRIEDLLAATS
jgi:glutathione peroxidase